MTREPTSNANTTFYVRYINIMYRGAGRVDDQYGSGTNDQFNNNDLEINNENYNNPKVLVSIDLNANISIGHYERVTTI